MDLIVDACNVVRTTTYFMPFMLSSRPLPDLVDKRVEVFEISEKDFVNSKGRKLRLSFAATE